MTKKDIITQIFNICKKQNNFIFNNDLVKKVLVKSKSSTNPYDMTKIDDISKLPEEVVEQNYCIIHLGNGNHKFIKGINKIYHNFEAISDIVDWQYRPSILNDFSISESSILSLTNNHRILHDFLYQDYVGIVPKMYNSERKRAFLLSIILIKKNVSLKICKLK
ncbi:MAG: hypothetical protein LBF97_00565 [Elusimicrobiota bacterium]|jgi:hypothetical protein|nr:hypothetical protein [Elusimicrobiota bacterium]